MTTGTDSPLASDSSRAREIFRPGGWRRFDLYNRLEELNVFEGHGLDLDQALGYLRTLYADALAWEGRNGNPDRSSAGQFAARFGDVAVWEGDRVLALFRPQPDGDVIIDRFDGKAGAA